MTVDVPLALENLARRLGGEGALLLDAGRLSRRGQHGDLGVRGGGRGGPRGPDPAAAQRAVRSGERPLDQPGHEAALIRATGARGAPVPPVRHICDEADGLGEAYVMGRIEGETLGKRIVSDPRFDAVRGDLARQCGEVLAQIHATPPPAGLALKTVDGAGELDRYEEVYRSVGAGRPILELAFQHLRKHAPEPVEPVLLHGDFRNGNLMFDPRAGLVAVLDWELSHIGDPAEDMGWICTNSWRFGRPDRPVGGFGDYEDLLAGYAAAGGRPIELSRVRFWQMLGSLRWGVMCLTMYMSWANGTDRSVERPMIGRRVSETEADLVTLLEQGL